MLVAIKNMQDIYCVTTDSVTDIATAQTQERHNMMSHVMSCLVTKRSYTKVSKSSEGLKSILFGFFISIFRSKESFATESQSRRRKGEYLGLRCFFLCVL